MSGLADDQHDFGINQELDPWLEELFVSLETLIGKPPVSACERQAPISAFTVELVASASSLASSSSSAPTVRNSATDGDDLNEIAQLNLCSSSSSHDPHDKPLFELLKDHTTDRFNYVTRHFKTLSKQSEQSTKREPSLSGGHTPHLRGGVAQVRSCGRLTADDHFQDVRRLCLDTNIDFKAGSVAVVYPKTKRSIVLDFLKDIGISESAAQQKVLVQLRPGFDHIENPFPSYPVTIEDLFSKYVDILAVPGRVFFWALSKFCEGFQAEGIAQKEKLEELSGRSPEDKNSLLDYCGKEGRNSKEILWDFFCARPPLDVLLTFIPAMRPRYYSLASAPNALFPLAIKYFSGGSSFAETYLKVNKISGFELCIALVKWKSKSGRVVRGNFSQNCEEFQPGEVFPLDIVSGALIDIPTHIPLIMVCPGTGLSPCRAILQERSLLSKQLTSSSSPSPSPSPSPSSSSKNESGNSHRKNSLCDAAASNAMFDRMKDLVFLGFRHPDKDYLFGKDEWKNYRDVCHVFTTFSRCTDVAKYNDAPYVQHVIEKNAKRVLFRIFFFI